MDSTVRTLIDKLSEELTTDNFISIPKLCAILDVKEGSVRKWIFEKRIHVKKFGRLVRIEMSEVERIKKEGI